MKNQFDELTKNLAQSVTRRQALKKFGVGLAGMALACLGMANMAKAAKACGGQGDKCNPNQANACCPGLACANFFVGNGQTRHYCTNTP